MSSLGIRPKHIVIADNDPDVLDLLVTDLRAEGHEVVGAASGGDEALLLCEKLRPDVLVVDYRMPPGPNGIEVATRARAAFPGLVIVLYTNYRDPSLQRRGKAVGARVLAKGNIRALRRAVVAPPDAVTP